MEEQHAVKSSEQELIVVIICMGRGMSAPHILGLGGEFYDSFH